MVPGRHSTGGASNRAFRVWIVTPPDRTFVPLGNCGTFPRLNTRHPCLACRTLTHFWNRNWDTILRGALAIFKPTPAVWTYVGIPATTPVAARHSVALRPCQARRVPLLVAPGFALTSLFSLTVPLYTKNFALSDRENWSIRTPQILFVTHVAMPSSPLSLCVLALR